SASRRTSRGWGPAVRDEPIKRERLMAGHDVIDLRSDTLTLPTPEMREAMARAEVGDDVWGEDPTVRRLEALAAQRLGKPAALFVTSGTQGNLVLGVSHTRLRSDGVICLQSSGIQHIV